MGVLTSRPADMRTVQELQEEANSPSAPLTGLEGALTEPLLWLQNLVACASDYKL